MARNRCHIHNLYWFSVSGAPPIEGCEINATVDRTDYSYSTSGLMEGVGTMTTNGSSAYDTCIEYGALYNSYAVEGTGTSSISSSDDWYLPSLTDYEALITLVDPDGLSYDNTAALYYMESGTDHWLTDAGLNTYGLTLKGVGQRLSSVGFTALKTYGYYWLSDVIGTTGRYSMGVYNNDTLFTNSGDLLTTGNAVILVKNATGIANGETTQYTGNNGKIYNAVCINEKYWLTDPLTETEYRDNSPIYNVTDQTTWNGLTTGALCAYNNVLTNASCDFAPTDYVVDVAYGYLYNWYTVDTATTGTDLANTGWHVPTHTELITLDNYVGSDDKSLQETGTIYWVNNQGTNTNKFNARGAGNRNYLNGNFYSLRNYGQWWSTTAVSATNAYSASVTTLNNGFNSIS